MKALNASGKVTKKIGATSITLTRCEWSNFFQSISLLPRYVSCTAPTHKAQLGDYEKNKNLHKISFSFGGDASTQDDGDFSKPLTLKLATKDVTASACEWYNLVQTEVRWPIYRACGSKGKPSTPKADVLARHKLNYSN